MAPTHPRSDLGWRQPPPERTPRLRLKRKALPTGFVDGAWWPRSTDLTAELPDLLAVLSVRLGAISQVTYRIGEWDSGSAQVAVGGRVVPLSGYRRQPPNMVEVLGVSGTSIMLLVVPPGADPKHAHESLMAAAAPDNAATTAGLLGVGRR